jgi:hypothetical protein
MVTEYYGVRKYKAEYDSLREEFEAENTYAIKNPTEFGIANNCDTVVYLNKKWDELCRDLSNGLIIMRDLKKAEIKLSEDTGISRREIWDMLTDAYLQHEDEEDKLHRKIDRAIYDVRLQLHKANDNYRKLNNFRTHLHVAHLRNCDAGWESLYNWCDNNWSTVCNRVQSIITEESGYNWESWHDRVYSLEEYLEAGLEKIGRSIDCDPNYRGNFEAHLATEKMINEQYEQYVADQQIIEDGISQKQIEEIDLAIACEYDSSFTPQATEAEENAIAFFEEDLFGEEI